MWFEMFGRSTVAGVGWVRAIETVTDVSEAPWVLSGYGGDVGESCVWCKTF
jgi:hypothetical protein